MMHPKVESLRGGVIVSCQAEPTDVLFEPDDMARMAQAAVGGGAVGIRANGSEAIRAIKSLVSLPIIGIDKQDLAGIGIRITPTLEAARALVAAGADMIAIEATQRSANEGRAPAADFIRQLKTELGVPIIADVATLAEGIAAAEAGADMVATTLSGYTDDSPTQTDPDFALIEALAAAISTPILAEGRIASPEQARRALACGAFAAVVGSMITKPRHITAAYAAALRAYAAARYAPVVGVDIGGTKIAVMNIGGEVGNPLKYQGVRALPTQAKDGAAVMLKRVGDTIEQMIARFPAKAIGVSTGGRVDRAGVITHATAMLPGYAGMDVAGLLRERFGLPVAVENDGAAAALAEARLGAGRGYDPVLTVTVGTGVGGGLIAGGTVYRGADGGSLDLGQLRVNRTKRARLGESGLRGCLEDYASSTALIKTYNARVDKAHRLLTGEEIGAAAAEGDADAQAAVAITGAWLGYGLSLAADLLNPAVIVVGGGAAALPGLLDAARAAYTESVYTPLRAVPIVSAALTGKAGVVGAALAARDLLESGGR